MSVCPSCNSRLSCGCQIRTASNGARVCTMCVAAYEKRLLEQVKTVKKPAQNNAPTNINVTYNPPK